MCRILSYVAAVVTMPANAAKAKPQPKVVKARRIITVDAVDENGRQRGLLERIHGQKRRPKKPLNDLFTKLAEKSTVDISQVRWGEGISSSILAYVTRGCINREPQ